MKLLLVIPDGWADKPQTELNCKTPLEAANLNKLDELAKLGTVGTAQILNEKSPTDTSAALLEILGIKNKSDKVEDLVLTGRGYYEALDWGIELEEGEIAARVQLLTANENSILAPNCGNLTSAEAKQLILLLNEEFKDTQIKFHYASKNNHIVTIKNCCEKMLSLPSPWEVLNKDFNEYMPEIDSELRQVMMKAAKILESTEINDVRRSLGEPTINFAYIWGAGISQTYSNLQNKFRKPFSLVSYSRMARGIAIAAGANMVFRPDDSNEPRKELRYLYQETRKALVQHDLVVTHHGFPDNYSKISGPTGKVKSLELIDELFITPIVEELKKYDNFRFLLVPTLGANSLTKTHLTDPVPFLAWGDKIKSNGNEGYFENSGAKTNYHINEGQRILEYYWNL